MRSLRLVLAGVLVVGAWGCGDEGGEGPKDAGDAGADARADGAVDAIRDAPLVDAPLPVPDAAGGDAIADTGGDAIADAGGDAIADAATVAGDAGACVLPACLVALTNQCMGTGACVQQSVITGTATTLSVCYANGVKERTFIDTSATVPIVVSVSQNGALCYSVEAVTTLGEQPQTLLTFKNFLGATMATGVRDAVTGAVTVTCLGQPPVQLGSGCPLGFGASQQDGGTAACTVGSCS